MTSDSLKPRLMNTGLKLHFHLFQIYYHYVNF